MAAPHTPDRIVRDGYVQEHTEGASHELLKRMAERAGDLETRDVAIVSRNTSARRLNS